MIEVQSATKLATEKFLGYFELVKELHLTQLGRPMEMYKPTEPDRLMSTFEAIWGLGVRGAEFVAELLNALVWAQCLGNGNHRTSVLFVRTFLQWAGVSFPHYGDEADGESRFEASLNHWITRSQALIRRRGEPGFAQARLAPTHHELTVRWVNDEIGTQSDALMMMGPQRLMDFISSSEMRG